MTAAFLSLVSSSGMLGGCNDPPPPLGSVLVVVDTDLPVPKTVSRLRVDLYAADGTWRESRDFPRVRPDEWPASFGLVSPDESKPTTVIVRVRAYPEGAVRDYRGESNAPRPKWEPPRFASTLAELCASLEELPPLVEKTIRRGTEVITGDTCSFGIDDSGTPVTEVGHVGARVVIKERDRYRFEVVRSVPPASLSLDTTLSLRRDCNQRDSELFCNNNIDADNLLSRLVVDLDPGTYTLLAGGRYGDAADITLRFSKAAEWETKRTAPTEDPVAVVSEPLPRLRTASGADTTPTSEPHPAATVERIVRVRLTPGMQGRARVVLGGACLNVAAKIAIASPTTIDPSTIESCNDGNASPLEDVAVSDADIPPTVQGTFLAEPCTTGDSDDGIACIPGGAFVMGGPEMDNIDLSDRGHTLPVRTVAHHRFWIDRREVTVGRYRQAVSAGFRGRIKDDAPYENDGVLKPGALITEATYSSKPISRESYPLNVIGWSWAREFCRFSGGDLPTEAQWEYVAGGGNALYKQTYPWGEREASCASGVLNRSIAPACKGIAGPEAVDSAAAAADEGPFGLLGLAGNLREMTRDASYAFDHPCWSARSAIDAWCDDPSTPYRTARGGSWRGPLVFARVAGRWPIVPGTRSADLGFRCSYPEPPTRRWSGL
jgi:formylglycine-generating enzyme required for sulfatase activity